MSIARFLSTDGQGNVSLLKEHYDWRDTWEHIVPLDVLGTRTRLLLYDRVNGDAKVLNTDGTGGIEELASHTGWKKSWDIITPGDFAAGARDDVLLYRRDAGEAKFFRSQTNGDLELLKTHDDWRAVWDIIVAGRFGGSGGRNDFLLYEQDTGTARFFTTDNLGNHTPLEDHTWETGWDIILPGRFGSPDVWTDLFFYRRADGSAKFFSTDGAGNIQLIKSYQLGAGWDIIVPGNFGGSANTDLLLYRRSDGRASFWTTDASGGLDLLKEHTWSTIWDVIVPGRFDSSSYTGLLLYAGGLNGAAAFGWRGCIDTDLKFSEFFSGNHTVMAHYMPQYPIGYAGPIWAENGSGAYFVGQGNFIIGTNGAKLRFEVGSQRKLIPVVPSPGVWRHIAVVREGNKFTLYMAGTEMESLTISPTDSKLPSPNSTLRLGRCTDNRLVDPENQAPDGRESQYYGIIDDVAVFTTALTAEQIKQIGMGRRIDGLEPDLLAGWTFDASTAQQNGSGRAPLPAKLKRPLVFRSSTGAAGRAVNRVILSPNRDMAYDHLLLPPAPARFTFPLPFNKGEVWRVVQGWGSAKGTHKGPAAFSLDLQSVACLGGCGEPVRSVGPGTVREVVDNDEGRGNYIIVQHHPVVLAVYMHNAKGSARVSVGDTVTAGQHLADIGTAARHLHFTVHSHLTMPDRQTLTIPYAFQPFDVCTPAADGTCPGWVHVKHGVPLNNQWIRWG